MSYLIDTNVISELVRKKPQHEVIQWFKNKPNDSLYISVLTLGEIRKGIGKIADQTRQEKLTIWLEYELTAWFYNRILSIDQEVADKWGRILASCKQPLPAIDSLLVATAIHFNLRLVTRNIRDFQCIPAIEVINPWDSFTESM